MEKKRNIFIVVGILCIVGVITVFAWITNHRHIEQEIKDMGINVFIETTDKAMYTPGDVISVKGKIILPQKAKISSGAAEELSDLNLVTKVYHLDAEVDQMHEPISIKGGESKDIKLKWNSLPQDYTGYLMKVELQDKKGTVLAFDTIGVDVSSDWIKFPRYGYVCKYDANEDTTEKIDEMNRFHINAIEYYDWQALHHEPLPVSATADNPGAWEDWSGRTIDGNTVASYIEKAHKKNMVNMAYNMIYAGTDTFFKDADGNPTEAAKWQLFFAKDNDSGSGAFSFKMGSSPSGNSNLYFLNPLNTDWQNYIFAQENHIFDVLDFDGWHGDTVGDWGKMTDINGNPLGYDKNGNPIYYVKDTYRGFLNAAKEALGDKYLTFNPVGAQGIEQADTSNVDVLYTEFWPWDKDRNGITYDTYSSIVTEVERAMEESAPYSKDKKGKSLVVKAYENYYKTNGTMNAPGVRLFDAAVYAAGGSRLELGNGDHMLHVEYYPDDKILMDKKLKEKMIRMNDFTVAYENLLRDGQKTVNHNVTIADQECSKTGADNKIWTYIRADDNYEILHLINLLGTDNKWRDERGKKVAPKKVSDLIVKYYSDKDISHIYLASPDFENGSSTEMDFKQGTDNTGKYYTFKIPSLEYWDMIYMKEKKDGK